MKKEKLIAVIGDIHGCYYTLCKLYNKLLAHTDEVYTVGDLIDRGPDSKSVIQFCIENNIKPVMGNHEDMLLKAIRNSHYEILPGYENNLSIWLWDGGGKTIKSYLGKVSKSFQKFANEFRECGHYDFISKLPLKMELESCIITHGGIIIDKPLDNVLWNRQIPSILDKLQIIGHTTFEGIVNVPNHFINIDTGCVFGGKLTGIIINEITGELIQTISEPSTKKKYKYKV
jgi:serine/threonine protein phosphatase 1